MLLFYTRLFIIPGFCTVANVMIILITGWFIAFSFVRIERFLSSLTLMLTGKARLLFFPLEYRIHGPAKMSTTQRYFWRAGLPTWSLTIEPFVFIFRRSESYI